MKVEKDTGGRGDRRRKTIMCFACNANRVSSDCARLAFVRVAGTSRKIPGGGWGRIGGGGCGRLLGSG